ncbi:MAG TPA: cyclic nucleotide-binding domain-containing protein [Thermoleophilia bacterium]|nr:cyclic nucleotide-binding domain-containing protein [Thermoleophilia bacterium]HQG03635.1 cyclic nucleotide-binding domain-containing protein [Thermoleophilia bacterium]HQG55148.1 cyclic nucleotide-binding domain-containing protein [Thermoleophilia bacterium]HQJ98089.1 cyclic nucleotide-binding domain-containing protein [Thermoleophilia bacterium]
MEEMEAGVATDALGRCEFFWDFDPQVIREIASQSTERFYDPGEAVFEEGLKASNLYVVETGRVGLMVMLPNGHEIMVLDKGPAEPFGWTALTDPGRYVATARCLRETALVEIPVAVLEEISHRDPLLGLRLMRRVASAAVAWIADLRMQLTAALD